MVQSLFYRSGGETVRTCHRFTDRHGTGTASRTRRDCPADCPARSRQTVRQTVRRERLPQIGNGCRLSGAPVTVRRDRGRRRTGTPQGAARSGRARTRPARTDAMAGGCRPVSGETVRQTVRTCHRSAPVRRDRNAREPVTVRRQTVRTYPNRRPSGGRSPQTAHRNATGHGKPDARANPSGRLKRHGGRLRRVSGETWRAWGERLRLLAGGCPSVSSMAGRSRRDRTRARQIGTQAGRGAPVRQTVRHRRGEIATGAARLSEPIRRDRHGHRRRGCACHLSGETVRTADRPARTVAADRERGETANGCAADRANLSPFRTYPASRPAYRTRQDRHGHGMSGERLRLSPVRHRRGRSDAARQSEPQTVRQIGNARERLRGRRAHLSGRPSGGEIGRGAIFGAAKFAVAIGAASVV